MRARFEWQGKGLVDRPHIVLKGRKAGLSGGQKLRPAQDRTPDPNRRDIRWELGLLTPGGMGWIDDKDKLQALCALDGMYNSSLEQCTMSGY